MIFIGSSSFERLFAAPQDLMSARAARTSNDPLLFISQFAALKNGRKQGCRKARLNNTTTP